MTMKNMYVLGSGLPGYSKVDYYRHPELEIKDPWDILQEVDKDKKGFFSKILKRLFKSNKSKNETIDPEFIKKFAKDVYYHYNENGHSWEYAPSAIIQDFKRVLSRMKNYMITVKEHIDKKTGIFDKSFTSAYPEYEKARYEGIKQYYTSLSKIILSPIFEQTLEYYYKLNTSATTNRSKYGYAPKKDVITSDSRKLKTRYSDV